jgi:AraC-like DNA-binding protein
VPPARHPASLGRAAAAASGGARRARIQFYEHGLGDWMRARRVPDGRLSGLLLDRELLGYQHSRAQFASWLEPPLPQLTLMIDLDGGLTANGERLPDAWIGGLDDRPTIVGFGGTYGAIDLKLTPLGAYTLVGLPLRELARACVPLRDVFGPEGDELVARVRALDDWDERFDVLEAFLLRRLYRNPAAPVPDPAVAWAFEQLRRTRGAARVEALAAELGCSRRYLRDGFVRQVGLPPKTVGRLVRFQHVRERIQEAPGRWSEVAYAAGYADQSHLNREFRELAGTTPSDFVRRLIPEGGVIGDRSH